MNTPTNQPPHRITPENPPQFPCWLFSTFHNKWEHRRTWIAKHPPQYSHWHPDQPTAPTAVPDEVKNNDYWRGYRARLDEATIEVPESKHPTLWRYLENAYQKQITFHTIGVNRMPDGGYHFYIHPQNVSGETEDYFIWPDPFNWQDMIVNKKDSPPPDLEKFKAQLKAHMANQPTAVPEATCAPGQPVVHIPPHAAVTGETPRTDKVIGKIIGGMFFEAEERAGGWAVLPDFARTLERELAEAVDARITLAKQNLALIADCERLERELNVARAEAAQLREEKKLCSNSIVEACLRFPNVAEYILQLEISNEQNKMHSNNPSPLEKEVRRDERDDANGNPAAWQQLYEAGHAPPSGKISEGIALLRVENAELRKDKEIVDWVERNKPNALCICTWGGSTSAPMDNTPPDGHVWEVNDGQHYPTFRAALSSALNAGGTKLLDVDNLYGSAKYAIDGLRAEHFIPSDDPKPLSLLSPKKRLPRAKRKRLSK